MITFMIALILGVIIGYWAYPLYMMIKLYRIRKRIEQIEKDFIKLKDDLYGKQWNEDKL